jgi:hypothetical protein
MVGSANLDGVSLHSYGDDFTGVLGRRLFRGVRNFDVNALVDAGEHDDDTAAQVLALRTGLWTEHLGPVARGHVARPRGGWLRGWRSAARRNVALLSRRTRCRAGNATLVLPYSTKPTPRAQLADVGVLFAHGELEVCFEPSWLEVRFSPSWVRNMFA